MGFNQILSQKKVNFIKFYNMLKLENIIKLLTSQLITGKPMTQKQIDKLISIEKKVE